MMRRVLPAGGAGRGCSDSGCSRARLASGPSIAAVRRKGAIRYQHARTRCALRHGPGNGF